MSGVELVRQIQRHRIVDTNAIHDGRFAECTVARRQGATRIHFSSNARISQLAVQEYIVSNADVALVACMERQKISAEGKRFSQIEDGTIT